MDWKIEAEFLDKVSPAVTIAKIVFKYLFENYEVKTIDDIAETTSGGTPLRGHTEYYGGDIPWIKSGELNDGLITKYDESITESGLKNSSAKIYPKGTLVLALYGATAGKVGILNFDSASNQAVAAVYHNNDIEKDFLFWFFKQKRSEYIEISFGAAQPNISQAVVKKTKIPVPKKSIQKDVANFLNAYEKEKSIELPKSLLHLKNEITRIHAILSNRKELIEETIFQQTYLQQLRQSILQEAVQGKLTQQNPTDEPGSKLLERIKAEKQKLIAAGKLKKEKELPPITEDEIPFELPNGWVWCRLGEICTKIGSGSTPRGGKEVYQSSGVKFIRSQNVYNEGLVFDNVAYIDKTTHKKMEGTRVFPNDLLLNITGGSIGRCALVASNFDEANVSQHVTIIRTVLLINQEFIHRLIISPYFQDYIMKAQTGGNREGLAKKNMELMLIPLPPLSEQQRIVTKVQQLMQMVNQLERQVQQSQTQAQQLLQAVLKEAFGSKELHLSQVK